MIEEDIYCQLLTSTCTQTYPHTCKHTNNTKEGERCCLSSINKTLGLIPNTTKKLVSRDTAFKKQMCYVKNENSIRL